MRCSEVMVYRKKKKAKQIHPFGIICPEALFFQRAQSNTEQLDVSASTLADRRISEKHQEEVPMTSRDNKQK